MELSAASLWEWTKLFVRDPRLASSLVKEANLALEVSVLMIVLAGVVSGVTTGILQAVMGNPPIVLLLADGQTATFEQGGPLTQGVTAVCLGLALGYALFKVGRWMGGQGSLADIMAVTAVLQMIMTVIVVARTIAILVLPLVGLLLIVFGMYVFFRGLGHAVNVGHEFDSMGKSAGVIVMSFFAVLIATFFFVSLTGIGPDPVMGLAPEGVQNDI